MVKTIIGKSDFIESLRGKSATFMLAISNTKTANIDGITQAGIPGKIYLTPTLDSEFVCIGEVRSLGDVATTSKGVPTPALMTRAVHLGLPFGRIELLDLGLEVKPKIDYFTTHSFGIESSGSIDSGAGIDAEALFEKGVEFGQGYNCKDEYIILAESVPSGTTTATATALGLGYDAKESFSSSFKESPKSIRQEVIKLALANISDGDELFDILGKVSDNMLIFNAGFILGVNNRIPILLAGGTQMACVLLVVDSILKLMGGTIDTSNLAISTTKWVYEDTQSDIESLLNMVSFPINGFYVDFDFSMSSHPALKLYDDGEAKEGVGAGGALTYGLLNGLTQEEITRVVEEFLG